MNETDIEVGSMEDFVRTLRPRLERVKILKTNSDGRYIAWHEQSKLLFVVNPTDIRQSRFSW